MTARRRRSVSYNFKEQKLAVTRKIDRVEAMDSLVPCPAQAAPNGTPNIKDLGKISNQEPIL